MKKLLFVIALLFYSLSANAGEIYEMQYGCDYLFFLNEKVYSIKSNAPKVITAQRISTYKSDDTQILFSPQDIGDAEIQLNTSKGVKNYSVSIKNYPVKENDTFIKLDVPEMVK